MTPKFGRRDMTRVTTRVFCRELGRSKFLTEAFSSRTGESQLKSTEGTL